MKRVIKYKNRKIVIKTMNNVQGSITHISACNINRLLPTIFFTEFADRTASEVQLWGDYYEPTKDAADRVIAEIDLLIDQQKQLIDY